MESQTGLAAGRCIGLHGALGRRGCLRVDSRFVVLLALRVELEECGHHIHYLPSPLLQLRYLAVKVLNLDDVHQDLADSLQEPPQLREPPQEVPPLLTPVLDEADVREELRMVRRQVQDVEEVGEGLEEYHLDRTVPVLPEPLYDFDYCRYLNPEAHDLARERALLCKDLEFFNEFLVTRRPLPAQALAPVHHGWDEEEEKVLYNPHHLLSAHVRVEPGLRILQ